MKTYNKQGAPWSAYKKMDHAEYQKKTRTMSEASLHYVMSDCRQALAAMPDSPNADYYMDEINYCAMELYRRSNTQR